MPGVCGFVSSAWKQHNDALIDKMIAPMRHSSSYKIEKYVDGDQRMGMARVSLGFVNTARQPVTAGDGQWLAVMDGELHETDQLVDELSRHQVTIPQEAHAQIILEGYRLLGESFLRRLHGTFVAVIWNCRQPSLTVISDRFGMHPVYYAHRNGRFIFGSNMKSLINAGAGTPPDWRGIAQFFTYGQYVRDDTSIEAIKVVPAASTCTFDNSSNAITIRAYANLPLQSDSGVRKESDWLERVDTTFCQAVDRRMNGNDRLGIALSGGLDGRTMLAVMDRQRRLPRAVCYTMPGSLDEKSSRQMSRLAGCDYHHHVLGPDFLNNFQAHLDQMVRLTDGQYLSQCIVMPTLPVYPKLGIDVLLRGHAGELMHMHKAYSYSLSPAVLKRLSSDAELEAWLNLRLPAFMLDQLDRPLFSTQSVADIQALAKESLRDCLSESLGMEPAVQRVWHLFVRQRLRRETALSLAKFRSVTEIRTPYLDNDLVDVLVTMPPSLKMSEKIQAYILKKHLPEFLRIPNANTAAAVGARATTRRLATLRMKILAKLGVPGYQPYERLGAWLRRELSHFVCDILLSEECLDRGVYAADTLRRVITQHTRGQRNHTFLIMALMIFELGQRYLQDSADSPGTSLRQTDVRPCRST